ncbi:MAG: aminomethyl-transferring glycine dehydrogenase subunit GcvPA [Chloroflexota bacterium]|nr:aminomethyl-transferring glycine dehydrogenase subunit GcvPA [Chloroflexota bacterium]
MTSPYIPNTEADRQAMLRAIGVPSAEGLFQDIPEGKRHPPLRLPPPLSEMELLRELDYLSRQNASLAEYACFLGAGAYRHFIPSVVRHLAARGEFYTAYTPYQPEISQGTLQAMYEFQSLICQLTAMEAANDGMYDGASALAEAALMACRVTGRHRVAVSQTLSHSYREVLQTYVCAQGIEIDTFTSPSTRIAPETACLLVQSPNFFGYLEDLASLSQAAHEAGALCAVVTDPIALGLFQPPGYYGVDIVVGEGQPLGTALNFGGPYIGLFATRDKYLRQMPGRVVGRTVDARGQTGYVLTLQTREQHIRRERATSNICTSEALVALVAAIYLGALGKQGLRQVAELCYHKAHYAAQRLSELRGYSMPFSGVFFKEFVLRCPLPPKEINARLLARKIIGGLDISDLVPQGMLLCVTEMNTRQEIDALVDALGAIGET